MPLTLDLSDREREKGNDESKSVCCCVYKGYKVVIEDTV